MMEMLYKDKRTQTLLHKQSAFLKVPKHTLALWNDLKACMSVLEASQNMQEFMVRASQLKRKRKPSVRPKILDRGERAGQISIRLNEKDRLMFEPLDDTDIYREDKSVAWENITGIRILGIIPDHDFDGTKGK